MAKLTIDRSPVYGFFKKKDASKLQIDPIMEKEFVFCEKQNQSLGQLSHFGYTLMLSPVNLMILWDSKESQFLNAPKSASGGSRLDFKIGKVIPDISIEELKASCIETWDSFCEYMDYCDHHEFDPFNNITMKTYQRNYMQTNNKDHLFIYQMCQKLNYLQGTSGADMYECLSSIAVKPQELGAWISIDLARWFYYWILKSPWANPDYKNVKCVAVDGGGIAFNQGMIYSGPDPQLSRPLSLNGVRSHIKKCIASK